MDEESIQALVIGLIMFFPLMLLFISVGLGIAGLFQKDYVKTFSVLGLFFSLTMLIITTILFIIGLLIS